MSEQLSFYKVSIGTKSRKGNWLSVIEKVVSSTEIYDWKIRDYFAKQYSGFIVEVSRVENVSLEPIVKSVTESVPEINNKIITKKYTAIRPGYVTLEDCAEKTAIKDAYVLLHKAESDFINKAKGQIEKNCPYLRNISIKIHNAYYGEFEYTGDFIETLVCKIEEHIKEDNK